jgi:hypothetical protein
VGTAGAAAAAADEAKKRVAANGNISMRAMVRFRLNLCLCVCVLVRRVVRREQLAYRLERGRGERLLAHAGGMPRPETNSQGKKGQACRVYG